MEILRNLIFLGQYQTPLNPARWKAAERVLDCVKTPEKCRPRRCLNCFHNESLPYGIRIYTYSTQATFRKHMESEHFSQCEPDELRTCPACEILLENEKHFKNHALDDAWCSVLSLWSTSRLRYGMRC